MILCIKYICQSFYTQECGVRFHSPSDMARVSTGYVGDKGFTSFGEFPWHVSSGVANGGLKIII